MARVENEIERLEWQRLTAKERELMADRKKVLEKQFGQQLGASLFNYAYGNLPDPHEADNQPYVKKRERDKVDFAKNCAEMLGSSDENHRMAAVDAILTANEILAGRIAEKSASKYKPMIY